MRKIKTNQNSSSLGQDSKQVDPEYEAVFTTSPQNTHIMHFQNSRKTMNMHQLPQSALAWRLVVDTSDGMHSNGIQIEIC